jgi:hypothetical protein
VQAKSTIGRWAGCAPLPGSNGNAGPPTLARVGRDLAARTAGKPTWPLAAQQQPRAHHRSPKRLPRLARSCVPRDHKGRLIHRTAAYGPVCTVVWEGEAARPTLSDLATTNGAGHGEVVQGNNRRCVCSVARRPSPLPPRRPCRCSTEEVPSALPVPPNRGRKPPQRGFPSFQVRGTNGAPTATPRPTGFNIEHSAQSLFQKKEMERASALATSSTKFRP